MLQIQSKKEKEKEQTLAKSSSRVEARVYSPNSAKVTAAPCKAQENI